MGIADIEKVADMDESQDIVKVFARYRVPRIRQVTDEPGGFAERHIAVNKRHISSRPHDFGDDRFRGVKNVIEDNALVLAELVIRRHQYTQLIVAHSIFRFIGIKPEDAHECIDVFADKPDKRRAYRCNSIYSRDNSPGDLHRPLQRYPFRCQF